MNPTIFSLMNRTAHRACVVCCLSATLLSQSQPNSSALGGEIYKKDSPAVVLIEMNNDKGEVTAAGSGFLVSADGKILTNYHVIAHSKQATVRLAN